MINGALWLWLNCWVDLQSVHWFRCYDNMGADREMSASACTHCMPGYRSGRKRVPPVSGRWWRRLFFSCSATSTNFATSKSSQRSRSPTVECPILYDGFEGTMPQYLPARLGEVWCRGRGETSRLCLIVIKNAHLLTNHWRAPTDILMQQSTTGIWRTQDRQIVRD